MARMLADAAVVVELREMRDDDGVPWSARHDGHQGLGRVAAVAVLCELLEEGCHERVLGAAGDDGAERRLDIHGARAWPFRSPLPMWNQVRRGDTVLVLRRRGDGVDRLLC
jgi:hypothetical protein